MPVFPTFLLTPAARPRAASYTVWADPLQRVAGADLVLDAVSPRDAMIGRVTAAIVTCDARLSRRHSLLAERGRLLAQRRGLLAAQQALLTEGRAQGAGA